MMYNSYKSILFTSIFVVTLVCSNPINAANYTDAQMKQAGQTWNKGFKLYDQGESAERVKNYKTALIKYSEAVKIFNDLKKKFPDWNSQLVAHRIYLCNNNINVTKKALGMKVPDEEPIEEAPVKKLIAKKNSVDYKKAFLQMVIKTKSLEKKLNDQKLVASKELNLEKAEKDKLAKALVTLKTQSDKKLKDLQISSDTNIKKLKEENNKLSTEIKQIKAESKLKNSSVDKVQVEFKKLRSDLLKSEEQLKIALADNKKLKKDLEKSKNEMAELKSKVDGLSKTSSGLEEKLKKVKGEKKKSADTIKKTGESYNELLDKIGSLQKKADETEKAKKRVLAEQKKLKSQLDAANKSIKSFKENESKIVRMADELNKQNKTLVSKNKANESKIKELQAKAVKDDADPKLMQRIQELIKENKKLSFEIKKLQANIVNKDENFSKELKAKLAEATENNKDAEKVKELEKINKELNDKLTRSQNEILNLRKRSVATPEPVIKTKNNSADVAALKKENKHLKEQLDKLISIDSAKREKATDSNVMSDTEKALMKARSQAVKDISNINLLKDKVKYFEELLKAEKEKNEKITKAKEEPKVLKTDFDALQIKFDKLTQDVEELVKKNKSLTGERDSAIAAKEAIKQENRELRVARDKTESGKDALKKRIQDLQKTSKANITDAKEISSLKKSVDELLKKNEDLKVIINKQNKDIKTAKSIIAKKDKDIITARKGVKVDSDKAKMIEKLNIALAREKAESKKLMEQIEKLKNK